MLYPGGDRDFLFISGGPRGLDPCMFPDTHKAPSSADKGLGKVSSLTDSCDQVPDRDPECFFFRHCLPSGLNPDKPNRIQAQG